MSQPCRQCVCARCVPTCWPARGRWWPPWKPPGTEAPPGGGRGRTAEAWPRPSAATRPRRSGPRLRADNQRVKIFVKWQHRLANERKWRNSTRGHCAFKNRGPSSSRTFIHVVKVLVELPVSCFVVDLLLHHVAPVLDVMSDGHLLQAALRVPQRPPRLLDLATQCDSHT